MIDGNVALSRATSVHNSKTSHQLVTTAAVDVVGVVSVTGWAPLLGDCNSSTHPHVALAQDWQESKEVDC